MYIVSIYRSYLNLKERCTLIGFCNSTFINRNQNLETKQEYQLQVGHLRDWVSLAIAKKPVQVGTIQGFKLVDSSGVDLVVHDDTTTWLFANELELVH